MPQVEVQNHATSGQHILVAEDDIAIGCLITEILCSEGFIVTMADSAEAAASILEIRDFHLLLTDVRMPGVKDGIDLAISAQQQHPHLPIVIFSGYAEELSLRLKKLRGRVTLLGKPFRINDLLKAIRDGLQQVSINPLQTDHCRS